MSLPAFTTPSPGRSRNMAAIRSYHTKPELAVRRSVHRDGFRYRLHAKDVPGRPDLLFPRHRLAVFVHGCFWHGHDCKVGHTPRSNRDYWTAKINRNIERDKLNMELLKGEGWRVSIIRECSLQEDIRLLKEILSNNRNPGRQEDDR